MIFQLKFNNVRILYDFLMKNMPIAKFKNISSNLHLNDRDILSASRTNN